MSVCDDVLVDAILTCATKTEAAKMVGVSRTTLYARLRDPSFQEKLNEALGARRRYIFARSMHAIDASLDVLLGIIESGYSSDESKIKAASVILRSFWD